MNMNFIRCLPVMLVIAALSACSGGARTTANPNTAPPVVSTYAGPAPGSAAVQSFRISFWENVKANNRCGFRTERKQR